MEKIAVVNKPKGKTSYQIVEEFKKRYPGEKVGHAGTLDPLAEGVLIVLIGRATKKQAELMRMEKEYLVEAVFGLVTPSWDLEFDPVSYPTKGLRKKLAGLTQELVKEKLKEFEGETVQLVPPFSAVKVGGRRLYRLARKGKIKLEDLPRRKAMVYKIELLEFKKGRFPKVKIRMIVGKGTYVRSVIYQLGERLGVGAVVSKLVRTRIGPFSLKESGASEG